MLALEADNRHAAAKMDDASWRRTKRKMEEKARLYAAMKRGDVEDDGDRYIVDFDRKWAEQGVDGVGEGADEEEDDDDDDDNDEDEDKVEYTDEFGRTRFGTRGEAAREQRRQNAADMVGDQANRLIARPTQPKSGIIYGDTIQAAAFNPDEITTAQMVDLASRRDRELTPPEAVHYNADWEIRSKGTGFFKFDKDEAERQRQMEALERERAATERARQDIGTMGADGGENIVQIEKDRKKTEMEERRRKILDKRGKMKADRFLEDLGGELLSGNGEAREVPSPS